MRKKRTKIRARLLQVLRENVAEKSKLKTVTPYTLNIFKGKIFCAHCGRALHRQRGWRVLGIDIYTFRCLANSRIARGSCPSYSITENELITSLVDIIKVHADVVIGKSMKLRENKHSVDNGREKIKSELTMLRKETDKDSRMLKSLYESLVASIITADEYRDMRNNYETKIASGLSRVKELESRQNALEEQIGMYFEIAELIGKINDSRDFTASVVDGLIEHIRVYSDKSIKVVFRFNNGFDRLTEVAAT